MVLIGGRAIGKTEWARCLGEHFYNCGAFNLDDVDPSKRYAVFDDIRLTEQNYWYWKCWFGGQKQFTVTDKYRKKRTVHWGKPVIWCCNKASDPRRVNLDWDEKEWLEDSCTFIECDNKLY